MQKRGFALIALIILVVLIGIIAYPTSSLIFQSLRHNALRAQKFQALAAAQAGLMKAAYEKLENNSGAPASALLSGAQYYTYDYLGGGGGSQAKDFVYIDASGSGVTSGNRNVYNWNIINASTSANYTITHITVIWDPPSGRRLNQIWLGNTQRWNGSQNTSGIMTNITDHIIPSASTVTNNYFRFNQPMQNYVVSAIFHFSDGSFVQSQLYPPNTPTPPSGGSPTVIRSTGKFVDSGMNVKMRQTMVATFSASGGSLKITEYSETSEHLLP